MSWLLIDQETDKAQARVTLQEGLSADNVSVASNDGKLQTLTIAPSLTVEWSYTSKPIHEIEINIYANIESKGEKAVTLNNSFNDFDPSTDGNESLEMDVVNLLSKNRTRNGIDASEFTDSTEGDGPEETEVTVAVSAILEDSNQDMVIGTRESVPFTVSVDHKAASATVSGTLNTDGS